MMQKIHLAVILLVAAIIWAVCLYVIFHKCSQDAGAGSSRPSTPSVSTPSPVSASYPHQGGSPETPSEDLGNPGRFGGVLPSDVSTERAVLEPALPVSPSSSSTFAKPGGQALSITTLEGEVGEWWKSYLKTPKTGPWQKIPQDATESELVSFATLGKVIILDWEKERDRLRLEYGEDLLGFCKDERVARNDRNRQVSLKNLLNSIWPGAMP